MNLINKLKKIYIAKIECKKMSRSYHSENNGSSNKKIVLIGHNSDKQGAAVLLEYIAYECIKQGWDVELLVREPGDMVNRYVKACKTVCFVGKWDFKRQIVKCKKRGFTNAICNTTVNGDLVPILKQNGYMVETLVHELPQAIKQLKIEEKAVLIAQYSDNIVFPSTFVFEKFQQFHKTEKYTIRPQGLYLTDMHEYNREKSFCEINKELNVDGKKIVLNVATGEKRKGFDIFLKVAKNLEDKKDILFIWIGDYNKNLYDEVIGKNKPDNLILYGYVDSSEKLAQFYDCASVLLLTSREEPFGSIVLEAFHSGTPVIGFKDAGGFVDTVLPGITGELVEYEDINELQATLFNLLQNDKKLVEYEENCIKFVGDYKFDTYIRKITEIFDGE